jgi:transcriptional regulator with XRE-family HTH domain
MLKTKFSEELVRCLEYKYGRIPSASIFARDFNYRSPGLAPITPETARRWLRGLSAPTLDRLKVLIDWLELSPGFLLPDDPGEKNAKRRSFEMPADERELLAAYRRSTPENKQLLRAVAKAVSTKT